MACGVYNSSGKSALETTERGGRSVSEIGTHVSRGKDKRNKMEFHGLAGASPTRAPSAVEAGLESDVQAHLGRQLRALYDEVAGEPVPDRFRKLLEQLEQMEAKPQPKRDA
jgi:hypothetical protein